MELQFLKTYKRYWLNFSNKREKSEFSDTEYYNGYYQSREGTVVFFYGQTELSGKPFTSFHLTINGMLYQVTAEAYMSDHQLKIYCKKILDHLSRK